MLKLSKMFESSYSNCRGRSNENICRRSGGAQEKGKREWNDETQFTTKISGKTSLGPSYFVLYFIPSYPFGAAYYAETGHSQPLIVWLISRQLYCMNMFYIMALAEVPGMHLTRFTGLAHGFWTMVRSGELKKSEHTHQCTMKGWENSFLLGSSSLANYP